MSLKRLNIEKIRAIYCKKGVLILGNVLIMSGDSIQYFQI